MSWTYLRHLGDGNEGCQAKVGGSNRRSGKCRAPGAEARRKERNRRSLEKGEDELRKKGGKEKSGGQNLRGVKVGNQAGRCGGLKSSMLGLVAEGWCRCDVKAGARLAHLQQGRRSSRPKDVPAAGERGERPRRSHRTKWRPLEQREKNHSGYSLWHVSISHHGEATVDDVLT